LRTCNETNSGGKNYGGNAAYSILNDVLIIAVSFLVLGWMSNLVSKKIVADCNKKRTNSNNVHL
jgi:hypothetical protein